MGNILQRKPIRLMSARTRKITVPIVKYFLFTYCPVEAIPVDLSLKCGIQRKKTVIIPLTKKTMGEPQEKKSMPLTAKAIYPEVSN